MVNDPCGYFEKPESSVPKTAAGSLAKPKRNGRPSIFCRMLRSPCEFSSAEVKQCIDCAFLDAIHANSGQEAAFLSRCRAIKEFVDRTASQLYSSHAVTVVLSSSADVVQYDTSCLLFLRNNDAIGIREGKLCCSNSRCQAHLSGAIAKTISSGKTTNLLVHSVAHPNQRLSVSLVRMPQLGTASKSPSTEAHFQVVCMIARLDRRRFATARQLMDLFGLSTAEARLARSLCQGDSLVQYSIDSGLKMPTVRTQLRSVFAKTATDRQSTLVRLLSGIPVVRET